MLGTGSLGPAIQWAGIPMDIADTGTIVGFDLFPGNRVAWILVGGNPPSENLRGYVIAHGDYVRKLWAAMISSAASRTLM
jgi:hypothetical protein